MSMDKETIPVDWEYVLHDLKYDVCKYLYMKDLSNLTRVNKSWRDVALREQTRRSYIQQLHLYYNPSESKAPTSTVYVQPHVSLLIFDEKFQKSLELNYHEHPDLKQKLLEDFTEELPSNVLVSKITEILTTEDVEIEGTNDQFTSQPSNNHGLLGLFFPRTQKLQTRCTTFSVQWTFADTTIYLARELGLDDLEEPKSALLIFPGYTDPTATVVIQHLKTSIKRIKDGKDTIWTGELRVATNNPHETQENNDLVITVLRISSPSLESWTTVINLTWSRAKIGRKLYKLKEKVIRKRHCLALFCAPCRSDYIDYGSQEIMRTMKHVFPGIPFVGLFDKQKRSTYIKGTESESDERGQPPVLTTRPYCSMSIIVISYD